jgi:hypothetical protein
MNGSGQMPDNGGGMKGQGPSGEMKGGHGGMKGQRPSGDMNGDFGGGEPDDVTGATQLSGDTAA